MIPTQDEIDYDDPEQHFLWALRNMPDGPMTHPSLYKKWSRHLVECGFIHRDALVKLADESGHIHVSQLPEQKKVFHPAPRGPRHIYNPAAGWHGPDVPEPSPVRVPDIRQLTEEENQALIAQYRAFGYIQDPEPSRDFAEETTD